jgi:hypothetical protein
MKSTTTLDPADPAAQVQAVHAHCARCRGLPLLLCHVRLTHAQAGEEIDVLVPMVIELDAF